MPTVPAALLLATSLLGGFWSGATAGGATAMSLVLLLVLASSGAILARPFGRGSGWLVAAGSAVLALTVALAVNPRAGLGVVVFAPTLLVVPALVARWASRGPGLAGLALGGLGSGLGIWALVDATASGGPVAAPLGHHLLLAPVLLACWPAGWIAAARWSVLGRSIFVAPAVFALLGTRSLVALVALGAQVVLLAPQSRRWLVGGIATVMGLGLGGPRLLGILGGHDDSSLARLGYARAGWLGFLESPWWGHGPGSTPWVLGRFHPGAPGELVGDLHSLVLTVLFETGLLGAVVVVMALVGLQRRVRRGPACAGLLGVAVFLTIEPTLGTLAPWLALAVAAGLALELGDEPPPQPRWLGPVAASVLLVLLARPLLATHAWDRASRVSEPSDVQQALRRAVALDPSFPLYRWRLAVEGRDLAAAVSTARTAPGIAALALGAAVLLEPGDLADARELARAELRRAFLLDPDDAFVAWFLALAEGDGETAIEPLARALVAEPRLLAAPSIALVPQARRLAVRRVIEDESLPRGWRVGFTAAANGPDPTRGDGVLRRLADADPAASLSLVLFRHRPWAVELATVAVDLELASALALPPAREARVSKARPGNLSPL